MTNKTITNELEQIAKDELFIETLETQFSDDLDFHDVSVWGIKEALAKAYLLGKKHAEEKSEKK